MIDWITAFLPTQNGARNDQLRRLSGRIIRYDMAGVATYEAAEWQPVKGSYDTAINVRGAMDGLWISGNPVKLLTGQNLDGPENAPALLTAAAVRVAGAMPVPIALDVGKARLTRIDITRSMDLGAPERVREVLRIASLSAQARHQGRVIASHDTMYFGKHSRRHSVKMYCKHDELSRHPAMGVPPDVGSAIDRAVRGLLRIEVTVRGLQLKEDGLADIAAWHCPSVPREQWQRYWGRVEISQMAELLSDEVLALPRRLRRTYEMWVRGGDCAELMGRNTYYAHRRELRQLTNGRVDIATLQPRAEHVNVDPSGLVGLLNSLPEWHADGALAEWIDKRAA